MTINLILLLKVHIVTLVSETFLCSLHRISGFILYTLVLVVATCVQSLHTRDDFRSSYLTTWEEHALLGHMIVANTGRDITSCVHGCLSTPGCLSFNFGEDVSLCELNNSSSTRHLQYFTVRPGFVYGHWITLAVIQYVFTTLGAQGPVGPNNTSGYVGTSLEGKVQLNNGIQEWTVPYTGMYFIEVFGASGANGTCTNCSGWKHGGLGARIAGLFELRLGQKLKILVGQQGQVSFDFPEKPGGGGGGTFVTLIDNSPLLIAGGGGGGSISLDGDPGQAGQNGTRNGGASGSGGRKTNPGIISGTGAGLWGDGEGMFGQARSFRSGGQSVQTIGSLGGFGGGGYGLVLPGGGGGYSGGGVEGTFEIGAAGGGGSINNGSAQINESGVNKGDGKVIITLST